MAEASLPTHDSGRPLEVARPDDSGFAAANPDLNGRDAGNDRHRLYISVYYRTGTDHRTAPDFHAIKNAYACANPHIVFDDDAVLGDTLICNGRVRIIKDMRGRNDDGMCCDPHVITDLQTAVAPPLAQSITACARTCAMEPIRRNPSSAKISACGLIFGGPPLPSISLCTLFKHDALSLV
jgi:hypothetical protein